jgi:hypothetical protein
MLLFRIVAAFTHTAIEPAWPRGNLDRNAIIRQLSNMPGKHLVVVRYQPSCGVQHDVDHEWVYNDANIDSSKVVWARDMGKDSNRELLSYFSDRKIWFLNGDRPAPELVPYLD